MRHRLTRLALASLLGTAAAAPYAATAKDTFVVVAYISSMITLDSAPTQSAERSAPGERPDLDFRQARSRGRHALVLAH